MHDRLRYRCMLNLGLLYLNFNRKGTNLMLNNKRSMRWEFVSFAMRVPECSKFGNLLNRSLVFNFVVVIVNFCLANIFPVSHRLIECIEVTGHLNARICSFVAEFRSKGLETMVATFSLPVPVSARFFKPDWRIGTLTARSKMKMIMYAPFLFFYI